MYSQNLFRIIRIFLAGLLLITFSVTLQAAEKKKDSKDVKTVITQSELQSDLMAFSDRYFSIIVGAFRLYDAQSPSAADRSLMLSICTYSMSSSFTIAAEANPAGGMLDMVTMVTLGRMIFEESHLEKYGPQVQPMIDGFRKSETDVWEVSAKVLTPEQQQELKALIVDWRKNNPEILFFPSIRFSDFSAQRKDSEKEESGGLFKSVQDATQQVEEVRLLAERAMFLATRMPMLTGLFGNIWVGQITTSPDMAKILDDINRFSLVSERLAVVAEQLPDKFAIERDATIKEAMLSINELTTKSINETAAKVTQERNATIRQLSDEITSQRRDILKEFTSEEPRLSSLLTELRLTLAESNKLVTSTSSLVKDLNIKPGKPASGEPARPFNIADYQDTLKEASNTLIHLQDLIKTTDEVGVDKMLPEIIKAINSVEQKGTKWSVIAFVLGVSLILIFLVGSVIALLVYRRLAIRLFGPIQVKTGP
jgi:hypothetical protein